ncbi:DUF6480 family protein [Kitasatospora sp. GP82]|uniref:DUF6480 family protein n=1 Tax=Kitasatospora sp. GP82 TaxID=3035089 RepID=UPI00247300F9|nr:DUF6480 family protein [Kitasatospora sp. GP82]MDH6125011.1 hypothetical protein [Kitasatospora sp. GP82]
MSTPDPDPDRTAGLNERHTLAEGDTPPGEGGISGISYPEPPEVGRAWGPWAIGVIILVAVAVSVMLIGMIIALSG